jgi:hypothetical protein
MDLAFSNTRTAGSTTVPDNSLKSSQSVTVGPVTFEREQKNNGTNYSTEYCLGPKVGKLGVNVGPVGLDGNVFNTFCMTTTEDHQVMNSSLDLATSNSTPMAIFSTNKKTDFSIKTGVEGNAFMGAGLGVADFGWENGGSITYTTDLRTGITSSPEVEVSSGPAVKVGGVIMGIGIEGSASLKTFKSITNDSNRGNDGGGGEAW